MTRIPDSNDSSEAGGPPTPGKRRPAAVSESFATYYRGIGSLQSSHNDGDSLASHGELDSRRGRQAARASEAPGPMLTRSRPGGNLATIMMTVQVTVTVTLCARLTKASVAQNLISDFAGTAPGPEIEAAWFDCCETRPVRPAVRVLAVHQLEVRRVGHRD